jgi:glycolate oxidase
MEAGFFCPPTPDFVPDSTLGGMLALNAGGIRALQYGDMGDFLMGVHVVIADGRLLKAGRKAIKDVAGYNLDRFIAGSRGTLGLITQVLLKVLPLSAGRSMVTATFSSVEDAVAAATAVHSARISSSMFEMFDNVALAASATQCMDKAAPFTLVLESQGHPSSVKDSIEKVAGLCRDNAADKVTITEDDAQRSDIEKARTRIITELEKEKSSSVLLEYKTSMAKLPGLYAMLKGAAGEEGFEMGCFGCIGNGNLYCVVSSDDAGKTKKAVVEMMRAIAESGGKARVVRIHGLSPDVAKEIESAKSSSEISSQLKEALDPKGTFFLM